MSRYLLALDQGTTSSRAILFDQNQNIICTVQKELTQYYPKAGWVEHDPMEIYAGICNALNEVISLSSVDVSDIAAIGITNQRETTIVWDRHTGKPVYNAIGWQCRRTADICDELKKRGLESYIRKTTGLIPDAYFSGTKIKWIIDNVNGVKEKAVNGDLFFGTVDSWLVWKLTDGKVHITDYTNASRTMLYDIHKLCWDEKILNELDIPASMLPKVCNSSEIYGNLTINGIEIPIAGIAGDQHAALFGQGCFHSGDAKNTYGTGCFLLMNTGDKAIESKQGLITTIAIGLNGKIQYALEGSVFVGGAVVQWLRDEMHFISEAKDAEYFASKVPDTGGVYLVPAFTGLGAPYWDMYARGTLIGITRGTKPEHIIRAAQESIAYQCMDLMEAMESDLGRKLAELKVDGGASRDSFLMQFQSDILNKTLKRPVIRETTALGAAYLAGLATGVWKNRNEIESMWRCDRQYESKMDDQTRINLRRGWRKAVGRSLDWEEHK